MPTLIYDAWQNIIKTFVFLAEFSNGKCHSRDLQWKASYQLIGIHVLMNLPFDENFAYFDLPTKFQQKCVLEKGRFLWNSSGKFHLKFENYFSEFSNWISNKIWLSQKKSYFLMELLIEYFVKNIFMISNGKFDIGISMNF